MENNRNLGLLAVSVGVALAVLFALLGVTSVLDARLGFGLAAASLAATALLYIMYTRGSAVNRTGFGALLMVLAIALIIPILFVNQQQTQADATAANYDLTLQRGAAIFGQYCATCHGFQGQGLAGPQLNNNAAVNKFSDDDLTRIISAGIPTDPSDPTKLAMPAWSQAYGGSLTEDDISYLVAFIRSSDPQYRATKGLENVNGFDYVLGTLTNATQIAQYKDQKKAGGKPPASAFKDMTGQKTVTVPIVNNAPDTPAANWGFEPNDIIINVGTTVHWANQSSAPHTVVSLPGAAAPFDSTKTAADLAAGTGTFDFTFTKAGDYPYFCSIHPAMKAYIIVK